MRVLQTILLAAGVLVVSAPALADPPWARGNDDSHEGRREKEERHERREHREYKDSHKRRWHESFIDDDRVVVRDYYSRHRDHVPPGLAKKGGVPPGLTKKGGMPPGLARGEVMSDAHYKQLLPLPPDLDKLLPPPPHEVARMILDHHIVLVHKQTHKILDVLHDALP